MEKLKQYKGTKLIYKHRAPVWVTIIFSLIMMAVPIVCLFVPYVSFTSSDSQGVIVNGISIIKNMFFIKDASVDQLQYYLFMQAFDGNNMLEPILKVCFFIIGLILMFMLFFAFLMLFRVAKLLIAGRLNNYHKPTVIARFEFIFSLFYFGPIIGIAIFANVTNKSCPMDIMLNYILLPVLFASLLVIHITYKVGFKNGIYVRDEEQLNKYLVELGEDKLDNEVTVTDTNEKKELPLEKPAPKKEKIIEIRVEHHSKTLPKDLTHIGGHAFAQNTYLEEAKIPLGIEVLGPAAFANCVNLRIVYIPESIKKIEYNCFFNCMRLERIYYAGSREMWRRVKRGSNWLTSAGTKFVVCRDGALSVDPSK